MSYARSPRAVCSTTIGTKFKFCSFMASDSIVGDLLMPEPLFSQSP